MAFSIQNDFPVQSLYDDVIKSLSPVQRLKLATLILGGIPAQAVIDYGTEWSDDDLRDFSNASLNDFEQRFEDEENAPTG